jgi:cell wall assembly regulator SMI1
LITATWKRLEAAIRKQDASVLAALNPAASLADLAALESGLGMKLPKDLRSSLLRHNGERPGGPGVLFGEHGEFLSCQRILESARERFALALEESEEGMTGHSSIGYVDGPVRPVSFHPRWIPVCDLNGDVFLAIDLAPARGGTVGQLISVDWECVSWRVVAPSLGALLETVLDGVQSGALVPVDGVLRRADYKVEVG